MTYFRKRLSPVKPDEPIDYKDVIYCVSS